MLALFDWLMNIIPEPEFQAKSGPARKISVTPHERGGCPEMLY